MDDSEFPARCRGRCYARVVDPWGLVVRCPRDCKRGINHWGSCNCYRHDGWPEARECTAGTVGETQDEGVAGTEADVRPAARQIATSFTGPIGARPIVRDALTCKRERHGQTCSADVRQRAALCVQRAWRQYRFGTSEPHALVALQVAPAHALDQGMRLAVGLSSAAFGSLHSAEALPDVASRARLPAAGIYVDDLLFVCDEETRAAEEEERLECKGKSEGKEETQTPDARRIRDEVEIKNERAREAHHGAAGRGGGGGQGSDDDGSTGGAAQPSGARGADVGNAGGAYFVIVKAASAEDS